MHKDCQCYTKHDNGDTEAMPSNDALWIDSNWEHLTHDIWTEV